MKASFFIANTFILSVQFSRSVMSDSLQSHGLQHTRLSCPSPNVITIFYIFFITRKMLILFFLIFIGVQLLYNVMLVSTVQQSETDVCLHISPIFWISLPFRSPQSTEQSSLCYTLCSRQLSTLYIELIVYKYQSQSIQPPLFFPLLCPYFCFLCLYLYFCFANKISIPLFQIPLIWLNIKYLSRRNSLYKGQV